MAETHDIQKYKTAKILVSELENLRIILKESFKQLNRYKKYVPVRPILNEILSAEVILKLHLDKQKDILKNKGKIPNEQT